LHKNARKHRLNKRLRKGNTVSLRRARASLTKLTIGTVIPVIAAVIAFLQWYAPNLWMRKQPPVSIIPSGQFSLSNSSVAHIKLRNQSELPIYDVALEIKTDVPLYAYAIPDGARPATSKEEPLNVPRLIVKNEFSAMVFPSLQGIYEFQHRSSPPYLPPDIKNFAVRELSGDYNGMLLMFQKGWDNSKRDSIRLPEPPKRLLLYIPTIGARRTLSGYLATKPIADNAATNLELVSWSSTERRTWVEGASRSIISDMDIQKWVGQDWMPIGLIFVNLQQN
jgi:hypothetical protein